MEKPDFNIIGNTISSTKIHMIKTLIIHKNRSSSLKQGGQNEPRFDRALIIL